MKELLKKLDECSLSLAFREWVKAQKLTEKGPADALVALASAARAAGFSGECQDWIRDRAAEVK